MVGHMKVLCWSRMLCIVVLSCGWWLGLGAGAAQAASYSGKVLTQDGNPVAGANVWMSAIGLTKYSLEDGTIKRATTPADGSFRFDIDAPPQGSGIVLLRVQADNFAPEDTVMKAGEKVVKLSPANSVRGIVKNPKGEPVPDVPVQLVFSPSNIQSLEGDIQEGGMNVFVSLMAWTSALPAIQTKSGADGKWALNAAKTAIIGIKDPRFAFAFGMSGMGGVRGLEDSGFLTLTAQPGASVKGKLLTTEGKPLKDAFVIAASGVFGTPAKVNDDGTFVVDGLPPGPASLVGLTSDPDWIIAPLQVTKPLVAGTVTDAPDWKAAKGIEVTGVLINKKTGKPIVKASINSVISGGTQSDEQGRWKLRTSPQMGMLQIMHPDYAPYMKQLSNLGDGPIVDIGQISMNPVLKVKGRLLDTEGKPVPNVIIMASVKQEPNAENFMPSMANATTDTTGDFELKLAQGQTYLTIQDKKWELKDGLFYIFRSEDATAPLSLKAKKLTPQKATGRVLRPNGQPVVGATVVAEVVKPDVPDDAVYFSNRDSVNAETDAQGRFSAEVFGTVKELNVLKVEGDQYIMRQKGKGKKEGEGWQLSDTVVALLNGTVKGRVLDAKGAPAIGAWVSSPEASTFAPVQTDATGNFSLDKLPEGSAVIFAAQNTDFARGTAKDGEVQLNLVAPARFVLPMRRQFFQQAAKDGIGSLYSYWRNIGSEKMLAVSLQADEALPYGDTGITAASWNTAGKSVLQMLAQSLKYDPAWLRANGLELLGKVPADKNEDERLRAEGAVAAALAFGDEKQRATAKQWLDFESKMPDTRDNPTKNANRWFLLAGIAGALDDARATNFTLSALTFADTAGKKAIESTDKTWGRSLGIGGAKVMSSLDGEWPIKSRAEAYLGAIEAVAPLDIKRAQALRETLVELEKDPEYKKASDADNNSGRAQVMKLSDQAENIIVRAIAMTDPAAGLALVEKQKSFDWTLRETVAREAWRVGKTDIVVQTLKPALEQGWSSSAAMSRFAVLTAGIDKDLSDKFWKKAEERLAQTDVQNIAPDAYHDYDEVATYAYQRAAFEPALSRLRLETLWPKAHPQGDKDETRYNRWSHYKLINAMMTLDPVRALEMMADTDEQGRQNARTDVIAYLLSDDKEHPLLQAQY